MMRRSSSRRDTVGSFGRHMDSGGGPYLRDGATVVVEEGHVVHVNIQGAASSMEIRKPDFHEGDSKIL